MHVWAKTLFMLRAECTRCGEFFPTDTVLTVCTKCGGALLFRYDLDRVASSVSKEVLGGRGDTFWKFIDVLPISSAEDIISLGEPYTPVLRLPQGTGTALKNVYIKDDGRLPTGTFKARGMAVAVSKLRELRVRRVAVPSAGNAASALAAYGALAGLEVYAFMPKDVPQLILEECLQLGARTYLVDGSISDAGEIVRKLEPKYGWFNMSTNKQPYRVEGYKAMAFEIAEQFEWKPPHSIVFPTGGGEGTIGLWKGFDELARLGWIDKIPRLIIVQAAGCAPLVKAFDNNEPEVKEPWKKGETIAAGLNVSYPNASYLIFRALKETKGSATAVEDEEIISAMNTLMRRGIYACPEAASTLAALRKLEHQRVFDSEEIVLLYLTGNAIKYFDAMKTEREPVPVLKRNSESLS
jgi:threonine synthase